jgi:subtilisin family serine protease
MEYNPRPIINETDAAARRTAYGNNMVDAASSEHGTHVGGIIGAVRNNGIGVDGVASNAIIMPVRAIPGGDERDEDVALAIRYATDNGAKIINMSFGKSYSPRSDLVYEAIKYASSKDVLLIHAAGNDTRNNDLYMNYPDGTLQGKATIGNWITVAASGPVNDSTLLADFSNFGVKRVDVLAPGVDILSLFPGGGVKSNSGTSMAAPVVSGVAALLRGLYPELNGAQIKKLIIESLYYPEGAVAATDKGDVPMKKLIRNPGIVNAERAVILAGSKYK